MSVNAWSLAGAVVIGCAVLASAQTSSQHVPPDMPQAGNRVTQPAAAGQGGDTATKRSRPVSEFALPRLVLQDQEQLWMSPLQIRQQNLEWILPSAAFLAAAVASDASMEHHLPSNPKTITRSRNISNAGAAAAIGTAGLFYVSGRIWKDDRRTETGLLSMEAVVNSYLTTTELKYLAGRNRPLEGDGRGRFREGGSSFPSEHSAAAWSVATVIAHQYPGWLTKLLAYGTASAVSATRVTGREHYFSDVLVGSAIGYVSGLQASRRAESSADDRRQWGVFERSESQLAPDDLSSTYIELDSWVYPAVERLSALGIVQTAYMGVRPWTRRAVGRMLEDVDEVSLDESSAATVHALRAELADTFYETNGGRGTLALQQVYLRTQYISSTPLNDGFHIGQTLANDFGRPYGHGWQQLAGIEARGESGRFSFFVRGEYQHTPSVAGYDSSIAQVIANQDQTPVMPFEGRSARDAFRLLDTYASVRLLGHDISAGKQSFWWGPASSGAMLLSNNGEPFYSVRISRTEPLYIPVLSRLLGPFRYDSFLGKLSGHSFPRQPYFHGEKISFRPTENLELGFSRDAVFAGEGITPMTLGTFWHSFTSTTSGTNPGAILRNSPGARHANFDFRYRLPFLRNWVTLYTDSVVHDDVSPIDAPRGAAVMPGIYLAKVPGISKLDLHVEGGTTDTANSKAKGGRFYYYQSVYQDGYTNKGFLLSSWLGREGTGGRAWATYWFNPARSIQLGYRTLQVSQYFVPNGVSQQDAYARFRSTWQNGVGIDFLVQVERWKAPLLAAGSQLNVTTQLQVSVTPKAWRRVER